MAVCVLVNGAAQYAGRSSVQVRLCRIMIRAFNRGFLFNCAVDKLLCGFLVEYRAFLDAIQALFILGLAHNDEPGN
jgi:hypothetical protein